ncbi:MAG: DUF1343 domain-containing protein [Thermoanaerobaculia bacterium]
MLSHAAAVSSDLLPAHLALAHAGAPRPTALFGPEHGFHGVEQDMVAAADATEPWTGVPVHSLYGADEESLRPAPAAFEGLDLLVIDLQDVGTRFYTYAATAVWAAEAALAAGCEVWVLDRPNPLGGAKVEGNLRRPGFESFVGAFELPVRHGLTLGELVRLEAQRGGWEEVPEVVPVMGWGRREGWADLGRPWVPPSPNLPSPEAAWLYPGLCLVEGTSLSEGRGTTLPFQLVGAPGVDPLKIAGALRHPGVVASPAYFKPQYQKHAGATCGGVRLHVVAPPAMRPVLLGVQLLAAFARHAPDAFAWRREAYEFVTDRPAIDLLAGTEELRSAIDAGDSDALESWIGSWGGDEERFLAERAPALLYD